MRVLAVGAVLAAGLFPGAASAGPSEMAKFLAGPWGRVDLNWNPYIGALSRNSCPASGISKKESIGLFGEGGTMWIEAGTAGAITIYDGGMVPRPLSYTRSEETGAVYSDQGVERRFAQVDADKMTETSVPAIPGVPGANYVRCRKKK